MSLFLFHHFFVEHLDVETPRSSGSRASEIVLELDLVPMANGGWSKGFTIKIGDWKGTKNRGMILINGICLDDLWHRFTQRNHLTLKYGKSPDLRTDVLKKITSESPNFSWGMFPSYVKLSPQRPGLATSGPRWPRGTNTLQSVIAKNKKNEASSPTLFHVFLVGGIPTPLKNDGVHQLGWWLFPIYGKMKFMFQATNQLKMCKDVQRCLNF